MRQWTVIAVTLGDGTTDYGRRIWSEKFDHAAAADLAAKFIRDKCRGDNVDVTVIAPLMGE